NGGVASSLGSKAGGQGATDTGEAPDAAVGAAVPGTDAAHWGQGVPQGRDEQEVHASARVLFARPLVPAARAAVPTETRGRPSDTLDSSQEVAAKVSSLLHASTAGGDVGPGVGGDRGGGAPGLLGASGIGSHASP